MIWTSILKKHVNGKMRTKLSKRSFTLIEMLIVMTLIAAALGTLSLQVAKALKGGRFESGVDQVMGKLTLAQELMLDFHTDVTVVFTRQTEGIECKLIAGRLLPDAIERAMNRYKLIKGIEEVTFSGEALFFDGTLGTTPHGALSLSSQSSKATLILNGYPARITRGIYCEKEEAYAVYPEEIISFI